MDFNYQHWPDLSGTCMILINSSRHGHGLPNMHDLHFSKIIGPKFSTATDDYHQVLPSKLCALYYNLDPDWVTWLKRFRVKRVRPTSLKNGSNSVSLGGHVLQLCSPGFKVYTRLYIFLFLIGERRRRGGCQVSVGHWNLNDMGLSGWNLKCKIQSGSHNGF